MVESKIVWTQKNNKENKRNMNVAGFRGSIGSQSSALWSAKPLAGCRCLIMLVAGRCFRLLVARSMYGMYGISLSKLHNETAMIDASGAYSVGRSGPVLPANTPGPLHISHNHQRPDEAFLFSLSSCLALVEEAC